MCNARDFGPYTIEDLHAREDEGLDLELEDGWLVELPADNRHAFAASRLRDHLENAARLAGAAVFIEGGRSWEITTPGGIRKPDVFVVPREVARASIEDRSPITIPGRRMLLVVEVITPHNHTERNDKVRKVREYAGLGVPQYWLAEFTPRPRVQALVLDEATGTYRPGDTIVRGALFEATVQADIPIKVSFDPGIMTEF